VVTNPAIWSLLVATLLGLMIGLERERKRERASTLFAGVRTFTLIALLGALSGTLLDPIGVAPLLLTLAALTTLVALGYWRESAGERVGATTEVAALLTFGLGVLAGLGDHVPALAGAVIVTAVLSLRQELHDLAGDLTRDDLLAVVRFAVVSLVVLPLLPDQPFGPWGVWNPRTIWWLVVLISGVSFLGYLAIKLVGPRRGIPLSGVLGGLTSSTAVTLAFAQRSREAAPLLPILAVGTIAASAVAGPRLLLVLGVVAPSFLVAAAVPIVAATAVLGLALAIADWRSDEAEADMTIRNPFELRSALVFAGLFALIVLVVQAARETLGESGVLLAATLAGLTDLDAISLSLAEQSGSGLSQLVASRGLALAVAANALFKGAMSWSIGGTRMGRRVLPWLLASGAAAIAAAWWATPWLLARVA
jgi:uncharacterized membrane protein (DUF4010 family)